MNKLCLLACLFVSVAATAQTGPKVVFVGDNLVYNWQQSAAFKGNQNWVGQAVYDSNYVDASTRVAANFQTALNLHPDIVFISTGSADVVLQPDSQPLGSEWEAAADAIIQMVQMAQSANVRVILGNVEASGFNGDYFNGWIQTFATAKGVPVVNLNYWIQKGCADVVPPPEPITQSISCVVMQQIGEPDPNPVLTDLGYAFITQLTQSVIDTYTLSIKGGYLSDMIVEQPVWYSMETGYVYQVNAVATGVGVQFTPQITWSDGTTRPMWNFPVKAFNAASSGTWWSSNPKVMDVDQHGHAVAYTSGTANIWFKTVDGVTFSPWTMTVYPWYPEFGLQPPVY